MVVANKVQQESVIFYFTLTNGGCNIILKLDFQSKREVINNGWPMLDQHIFINNEQLFKLKEDKEDFYAKDFSVIWTTSTTQSIGSGKFQLP